MPSEAVLLRIVKAPVYVILVCTVLLGLLVMYSDQIIRSYLLRRRTLQSHRISGTLRPAAEKEVPSVEIAKPETHSRRRRKKKNKRGNGTDSQSEENTSCIEENAKGKELPVACANGKQTGQSGKELKGARANRNLSTKSTVPSSWPTHLGQSERKGSDSKPKLIPGKVVILKRPEQKQGFQEDNATVTRLTAKSESQMSGKDRQVEPCPAQNRTEDVNPGSEPGRRCNTGKQLSQNQRSNNCPPDRCKRWGDQSSEKPVSNTKTKTRNWHKRYRAAGRDNLGAKNGHSDNLSEQSTGPKSASVPEMQRPKETALYIEMSCRTGRRPDPMDMGRAVGEVLLSEAVNGGEEPATAPGSRAQNEAKRSPQVPRGQENAVEVENKTSKGEENVPRTKAHFDAKQDIVVYDGGPTVQAEVAVLDGFLDESTSTGTLEEKTDMQNGHEVDFTPGEAQEQKSVVHVENGEVQEENGKVREESDEVPEVENSSSTREFVSGNPQPTERVSRAPPGLEGNTIYMCPPLRVPSETDPEQTRISCKNDESAQLSSPHHGDDGSSYTLDSVDSGCCEDINDEMSGQQREKSKHAARKMNWSPEEIQREREKFLNDNQDAFRTLDALARSAKIDFFGINAELEAQRQLQHRGNQRHRKNRASWKQKCTRAADSNRAQASETENCSPATKREDNKTRHQPLLRSDLTNSDAQLKIRLPEQTTLLEIHENAAHTASPECEEFANSDAHQLEIRPAHKERGPSPAAEPNGMGRRKSNASDDSGIATSPVSTKGFASLIDEDLRERIAHPKRRVVIHDGPPKDNILFINLSKRERDEQSVDESLMHENDELEEEEEAEWIISYDGWLPDSDDSCAMYMYWGFCSRGSKCRKRHPTCRYSCLPGEDSDGRFWQDEQARGSQSAINPTHEVEETANSSEGGRYAAAVKSKAKEETPKESQSYEEMFPAIETGLGFAAASPKPMTEDATSNAVRRPVGSERDRNRQRSQTENDFAIAEATQAEEYAQELAIEDEALALQPEADEYTLEYEPDDLLYDAAVSESLTSPQPSSERTEPPTSIPVWDSGAESESPIDVECGDEQGVCEVCMDRPKNATLLCGHRFCYLCSCQMRADEHLCAICRRPIITVIKTFN